MGVTRGHEPARAIVTAMKQTDANSARGPLLGGLTYFEYQRLLGRDVVIPWLGKRFAPRRPAGR